MLSHRFWMSADVEAYKQGSKPSKAFTPGPGFCSVNLDGVVFTLTPNQGKVIELLWGAYKNGTPDVRQQYIIEKVSSIF